MILKSKVDTKVYTGDKFYAGSYWSLYERRYQSFEGLYLMKFIQTDTGIYKGWNRSLDRVIMKFMQSYSDVYTGVTEDYTGSY